MLALRQMLATLLPTNRIDQPWRYQLTAEIAILNRSAVALASDSAVTIETPSGPKIFEGANKIFNLVKGRPVGVMIFGSAEHVGVPWETIIKAYRLRRNDASFATVDEYAKDFLEFVASDRDVILPELPSAYLRDLTTLRVRAIVDETSKKVRKHIEEGKRVSTRTVRAFLGDAIDEQRTAWTGRPEGQWAPQLPIPELLKKYRAHTDSAMTRALQNLPATVAQRAALRTLVFESLSKVPDGNYTSAEQKSGVVIAGFGEREFFPRLVPYDIYGAIEGVVRAEPDEQVTISAVTSAVIAPFAQREMVDGFLTGLNPVVEASIYQYFNGVATSFPDATLDLLRGQISDIDNNVVSSLRTSLQSIVLAMVSELRGYLNIQQAAQYSPIVDSVAFLPKDELAAMAESLVNLTSLKRRVSIEDSQTVGGPVDVAVISRGDGFVWIKRKHYFSQELNPSWSDIHRRGAE